jgi:hypothetical protein
MLENNKSALTVKYINTIGDHSNKIGWLVSSADEFQSTDSATLDESIRLHCSNYGKLKFSFICYPIGGLERFFPNFTLTLVIV